MSRYAPAVRTPRNLLRAARRVALAVAFTILICAIALGSAGVIALWSHPPGTAARAELTWHGDATLGASLDAAKGHLSTVAGEVDRLSVLSRGAIGSLIANQASALSDALTEGGTVAASIQTDSVDLRSGLASLPGGSASAPIYFGGDVLARRAAMIAALDATEGLGRSWATLTAGSLRASRLIVLLGSHDTTVAAAAAQGRNTKYADAIATLAKATASLDEAVTIRDQLANAADVSTLDEWIARNRRYDVALSALYAALQASGGKVNDAVRTAYQEEGAARAQLPPDTRGLVVIIAAIGQGGLNQAVIAIEQARGRLNLALEALTSAAARPAGPA